MGCNLSTNGGVSGVVGTEQFADVVGEVGSRAIFAASGIAEELHDDSLLSNCVRPQSETAGQISEEFVAAWSLVSQAAIVETQRKFTNRMRSPVDCLC